MVATLILHYHSVAPARDPDPLGAINRSLRVDTEQFRCQMEWLDRSFSIVSLDAAIAMIRTGSLRRRQACVTFDDGNADNYEHAFPILRSLGIPATIFLATQPIEEERQFYWERLAWHLAQRIGRTLRLPAALGGRTIPIDSAAEAGKTFDYLLRKMQTLKTKRREALLDEIGVASSPYNRPMTWDQASSMHAAGFSFGAHSHTHASLPSLPAAAIREEITASRDIIAKRLGTVPTVFAYPHGDFDGRTERVLEEEGVVAAVTTREGLYTQMSPRFQLPRMDPGNRVNPALASWVHDASSFSGRFKSWLRSVVPSPLRTPAKHIYSMLRTTYSIAKP